jgi:N-acetylmuramoyl-L-alanine amidase
MKKLSLFFIVSALILSICSIGLAADILPAASARNSKFLVCLDPGHEDAPDFGQEPVAPGSSQTKDRVSSGCRGIVTKIQEYELNLENALLLEKILRQDGYDVILTRRMNHVRISNVERAEFANANSADLVVRLHADWSQDRSQSGVSILVPDKNLSFAAASASCAENIKAAMAKAGFNVYAVVERPDLSGFNWSRVPVVLVEVGFMSNPQEDIRMSRLSFRKKLMRAVADGIEAYFRTK